MTRATLLRSQLDEAYAQVRARLDELTDDEFFWEPAPGCWRIFYDGEAGRWEHDYLEPTPILHP